MDVLALIALIARITPIAFIAFIASIASAQDTIPIDTLTITVTRGGDLARVPAAVSVVRQERIQAGRLGVTLDEALGDVPGLVVNNRYNFALGTRISMRGLGARAAFGVRGIRLLQDGIPLTMPDGQSNLNNIDLTSTGRIEVLRGVASMLHGNAAGGVVDIRSQELPRGFTVEARGAGASFGGGGIDELARFNLKLGGGSARTRYLISAARVDTEGTRDHARFEQNNLTARLTHGTAAAYTAFTLSFADAPVAQNPGSLPRDSARLKPGMAWPRNVATRAGEDSRQIQGGIEHTRTIGDARATGTVYGTARKLDNPLPFAYITLDRKAGGLRSAVSWKEITAGFDVEAQSDERAEYDNPDGARGTQRRDQTDRIWTIGPFARLAIRLSERATLTAGARYDRTHFDVDDRFLADGRDDSGERTMDALSPAAGMTYEVSPRVRLFASIGTSFQTPTTTELINAPPPAGQPCCAAGFNQRLEPERATSYEIGLRGAWLGRFTLDAAAYRIDVRDALVPFQIAQAAGRDFFRNAGRTRNLGFEAAAQATLTRSLALTTSYTFHHFTFVDDGLADADFEGNHVPGVPRHHWLVRPSLHTTHAVLEAEAEATSSYFADDANTPSARNDGVVVINVRMRAARPLGRAGLTPFAGIGNLTDRRYNASVVINAAGARYFEPAPGRTFFVGLGVRLAYPRQGE